MADSVDAAIGELPQAEYIDDSDRIPLEQGGVAKYVLGALLKEFINRNILDIRALTLPAGSDVTASYNAETGVLTLGIPRSLGAANSVDGVAADTSGDVPLGAVSYDRGQNLSDAQKARARANLGLDFNSGASYTELPDGTMIQWGKSTDVSIAMTPLGNSALFYGRVPVNFPRPFIDSAYSLSSSFRYGTSEAIAISTVIGTETTTGADIMCISPFQRNGNEARISWMAVGRWK